MVPTPRVAACHALAATVLLAALGACGPTIPAHDGYSSAKYQPWKKAKHIKWKDDFTAKFDDKVSYPAKKRARWYKVELPGDGELTVKMEVIPPDARDEFKLGFEVLDSGYHVIMRKYEDEEFFPDERGRMKKKKKAKSSDDEGGDDEGDDDDDDWGDDDDDDDDSGGAAAGESGDDLEWEQTLVELRAGAYYLHVYALGRLDAAEYSLKLTYKSGSVDHQSDFPAQVAFLEPLPVVPSIDDTPPIDCKTCDCKHDARCKLSCSACDKKVSHGGGHHTPTPSVDCASCSCDDASCKKKCKDKCGAGGTCVSARIIRPMAAGGGTKLVLNAGTTQGVQVGWKGRVVDAKGKTIEGGDFTVGRAGTNDSDGTVRASPDAVRAAGGVRLCPP